MRALHQFVAGFSKGDAISNEALALRRVFRDWGLRSDIFSEARRILPELRREALDIDGIAAALKPDDIVLLHLSIGSPVNDVFRSLPCRKAILYHNVTPAHYFDLVNKATAWNLARGRDEVRSLAGVADVVLADSAFNAAELREWGYGEVGVLPLVLDLDMVRGAADRGVRKRFDDGRKNILFVGRCAPNKRIEDVVHAFYLYHRHVDPASRLIVVGSFAGTERYYYLVLAQVRELGLENVIFTGSVLQSHLNAYYAAAHLFLCMSEHEGFCSPLIESMLYGVPVLAHAAAAVPETMDGAGVLFDRKDMGPVAEMMGELAADTPLRRAVLAEQQRRVGRYTARDLPGELRRHLAALLED